jgi:S1-C subfamily serine protease
MAQRRPLISTLVAGLAIGILGASHLGAQEDPLQRLQRLERQRIAVMAKVEPAVCAVMALNKPGGGSGVIISPRGWLLTNFHVTGKNKVMKIGLPDGKFHLADVIGVDPGGDIALCALRGKGNQPDGTWPYVELGDSDKLKIGGFAYAMGNPFLLATDFKPTVTLGIISGLNRYQKGSGPNGRFLVYPDCIQVDTPINPGNSGGPLFDENGLLVGINGRITIRDRGRVNTGVGFAVSINQIRNFLPDLLAGKHAEHGTLDMNAWWMKDPNTGGEEGGIFVQGLFEDSVAAKAGLKLGDQLLSLNGKKLEHANDLARDIGVLPAGFSVEIGYRRWNEGRRAYDAPQTAMVKLAPMDTGSVDNPRPNVVSFEKRPDWDAVKKEVDAEIARRKKLREKAEGGSLLDKVRKLLPGQKEEAPKKDGRQPDGKPAGKKKEKGKKKPKPLPPLRDWRREKELFAYMDRVVASISERLQSTLHERDPNDDPSERVEMIVERYADGKLLGKEHQEWWTDGKDFGKDTELRELRLSTSKDADITASLQREFDLDPVVAAHRLPELLKDAWLEGGEFVAGRFVWALRLRGPGKRSVLLDRDGYFPVGYRCRHPRLGGDAEVLYTRFAERQSGWVGSDEARVYVEGKHVQTRRIVRRGMSFRAWTPGERPLPSAETEENLDPLFNSVVKIFGASGLKGIESFSTGLVVSDEGHVLTWDQVSIQQGQTRVVLRDGTVCEARIVRRDEELGVVMLRIDTQGEDGRRYPLTPLSFPSESREHEPGEFLMTVGNMFKLAEFEERLSASFGVVVARVRSDLRLNLRKFPFRGDVLIVDAPSNPGMPGAGVFTIDGQLIGMMTPLVESRETNTQLSIVIPAHELSGFVAICTGDRETAKKLLEEREQETKQKGPVYTGIRLFDTGRRTSPPAYIDRVMRGSPAHKARLRPDDLIVRIDQFPIRTCAEYRRALRAYGPGDSIDLTFKRGNKVYKVTLELEAPKQ